MRAFDWIARKIKAYRQRREVSATIRYMFPAVLGTVLLLGASTISGVSESYVYLSSDQATVEVGDLFVVEVGVSAHAPINAVDITVNFPADKVEVFSVDRGQSVLTLWTQDPVARSTSVQLSGGTFRRGFIGEHQIVEITFRATATGQYTMNATDVTFVAGDGTGNKVPASNHIAGTATLFNFDETTSAEEIKIAIAAGVTTDLNQDGRVTLQDISAFMAVWQSRTQILDFDGDGRMTFRDFSILLADFFTQ